MEIIQFGHIEFSVDGYETVMARDTEAGVAIKSQTVEALLLMAILAELRAGEHDHE